MAEAAERRRRGGGEAAGRRRRRGGGGAGAPPGDALVDALLAMDDAREWAVDALAKGPSDAGRAADARA
eukprot:gene15881-15244_t